MAIAWDAVLAKPRLPATGGTVNSDPVTVPRGSLTMTLHATALAAAATMAIQALDPNTPDPTAGTWRQVSVFILAAGGVQALSAISGGAAVTIPISALGGGVIRFVASSDQSAAPQNLGVVFARI